MTSPLYEAEDTETQQRDDHRIFLIIVAFATLAATIIVHLIRGPHIELHYVYVLVVGVISLVSDRAIGIAMAIFISVLDLLSSLFGSHPELSQSLVVTIPGYFIIAYLAGNLGFTARKGIAGLEALRRISAAMSSPIGLDSLLRVALKQMVTISGTEVGIAFLGIESGSELPSVIHYGPPGEALTSLQVRKLQYALQETAVATSLAGLRRQCPDATLIPDTILQEIGFKAGIVVPVVSPGSTVAVAVLLSHRKASFPKQVTNPLQLIGNYAGIAIKNTNTFRKTETAVIQHTKELGLLCEIDNGILAGTPVENLLDMLIESSLTLFNVPAAVVRLLDTRTGQAVLAAQRGLPECLRTPAIPANKGITGWVLQNKKATVIEDISQDARLRSQEFVEEGFVSCAAVPLTANGQITGALAILTRRKSTFSESELQSLQRLARQASVAIEHLKLLSEKTALVNELQHKVSELSEAYREVDSRSRELEQAKSEIETAYLNFAKTLVLTLEARDPYTRGHSDRVALLARQIATDMGCPKELITNLDIAARLHDIGKIGIPDKILLKEDKLTLAEFAQIKQHPTRGVELVRFLQFLKDALPIIEAHQECYDGRGYPAGLKGDEIPFGARILAVADAYDAMTSERAYRPARTHEEAVQILMKGAGTYWDPEVVRTFVKRANGNLRSEWDHETC